ncbi:unnamed protein product [Callosobruchus maculatus]|uniref:Uncharacterized protein n=1 Tax=Callosobruchus maculatus TaxID=64391 RepID=A0A653DQ05_CALMS|nr:unnamed protein product [Callosobruchus maculatus]
MHKARNNKNMEQLLGMGSGMSWDSIFEVMFKSRGHQLRHSVARGERLFVGERRRSAAAAGGVERQQRRRRRFVLVFVVVVVDGGRRGRSRNGGGGRGGGGGCCGCGGCGRSAAGPAATPPPPHQHDGRQPGAQSTAPGSQHARRRELVLHAG